MAEAPSTPAPFPAQPPAIQRPPGVTLVAWLFIVMGSVGFVYHAPELVSSSNPAEAGLILLIRLAAVAAGIFLLRGRNWARWLLIAWMGYHVVLSAFHTIGELLMHTLILGALLIYLTRPPVNSYLRRRGSPE